ncbi:MAG: ABC transporter ATP-binding protein [Legionellales bacterium]|nr:ABC transporter ATP-binding protein [Legionellales bacterium]
MNKSNIIIDAHKLNKKFNGIPAVIDFALTLKKGEICGFLGPNGSGKTTTLRMLCGLLTPDSGEGSCLGFDLLRQSYEIKRQVGYMTQNFSLYGEMTVKENLYFIARIYGIKNKEEVVDFYMKRFNLSSHADQLTANLSGGTKQRLALTGCLLHKPKLLLLDEPTAGVDPKTRREFWDEVHKLSQEGITTLVSTHYMDEAARCTRLVYIAYGQLLAQGTASELIANSGLSTWVASGSNLSQLADELRTLKDIEQTAFFGDKLHVSGQDPVLLKQAILPFQTRYSWENIPPDLEDVFIHLVTQAEQNL